MTNFEKIKNELENLEEIYPICYIAVHKLGLSRNDGECDDTYCQKCEKEVFKWLLQEYKESILTDKEKTCLKKIIKFKRDSVIYISKIVLLKGTENEFTNIVIATKDSLEGVAIPDMPFEGMKLEREYSLEELGL